jgi:hypothetical protein
VDTNVGDYDRRYPIHLAAAEGELVAVDFLMFAKADISVQDRWGCVPRLFLPTLYCTLREACRNNVQLMMCILCRQADARG